MSTLTADQLLAQLNWRYATKRFDPTKKIPEETWQALESALVLTPSSFGLQPWKFVVIRDAATREKLKAASWGQSQIVDGSHLVVFAVKIQNQEADVDALIAATAEARNEPIDTPSLVGYKRVVWQHSQSVPNLEWNARQVYIALGNFMTSAAVLGVDTCPMEGLDPKKYDEILGLPEDGLTTAVACVAGYRAADDKYASHPKVRFPASEVIEHI